MADNHPRPEGGARGPRVVICHNSHGYSASTDLYPTVDWSVAPLHTNKFNFDSDKTKNHPLTEEVS